MQDSPVVKALYTIPHLLRNTVLWIGITIIFTLQMRKLGLKGEKTYSSLHWTFDPEPVQLHCFHSTFPIEGGGPDSAVVQERRGKREDKLSGEHWAIVEGWIMAF